MPVETEKNLPERPSSIKVTFKWKRDLAFEVSIKMWNAVSAHSLVLTYLG